MPARQENDPAHEAIRRIEKAKRSKGITVGLSGLNLTTIPDSLAQLANLQLLDLSHNQITTIPDSLAQLANLRLLDLSGNQITTIPDFLGQLANLQQLYLNRNQITTIPDSLAQLDNLQELDLANNQITTIPDSLAQLANLTHLFLHGNPRLGIPDEILGPTFVDVFAHEKPPKPPKEILTYYFAQRASSKPLNEAKLILVGRGGVGKTSLVKALTTSQFDSGEKTTEGIKISDWRCPLAANEQATIHIWDFGGQEMMHATHQFFLTARSLYLLVLMRRQGGYDEEADYWLRLIRAFGGKDAPVIVVLNKQKREPFDVNRGGWLEKYAGNIKRFTATDCEDARSIAALRETIQEELNCLQSLKSKFPSRWFAIKNELAHMGSDYISFEDYRALCRKHGEDDVESQNSLSGFLHDLGIALNYKNDPRLRFAYVLKPEWVTQGIYALLHAFVNAKGLFSHAEASQVLAEKRYPVDAADFILALMEQFELSFPLSDPKKRILIPQLLEDQQPPAAVEFKPAECLNFGYGYPIIPEGLLPRFIVRTHHLSEPATRWKSGVILTHAASNCRALVRAESADRQVRIHIDGPESGRRELLAIIRYNFDVIHGDYEVKPEELVYPVPEKALILDELQALRREGDTTVRVVLADKETVIKTEINDLMKSVDATTPKLKLFLSYSQKDAKFIEELRKDLKVMERNGLIRVWYDHGLSAGEKWEPRILQELDQADVIVCQLSRDFLASDFCVLTELDKAIQRQEAGTANLIAYVLKDCGWKEIPKLKQFQIFEKPIAEWRNKDKYWRAVAETIQDTIKSVRPRGETMTALRSSHSG